MLWPPRQDFTDTQEARLSCCLATSPWVRSRLALEEALHALQEALLSRRMAIGVLPERFIEALQQFALLGRELDRGFHGDPAEQVALLTATGLLDALAAQAEDPTGLRLG